MADDPNRDILPVKDDSCYGSVRCPSEIDPRERHVVCKLDRYQLEDRYLRLLEEVQGLKKLSNNQEDKIKRLTTKLMRSAASSRTCPAVITINDERKNITRLELENARLKDKAYTLKNQLLSHRGPRSPSRCRRVPSGISSGPTTYRSESARTKYQSQPREVVDENDAQNYLVKIEELESQRNEMVARITELESQIALQVTGIQREKVQDNVEYIRMWRQTKQANDKLVSVQAANDMLRSEIGELKRLLEETTKNNREVTAALVTEKQRLSEMDDRMTSAKDSQLSLREKEEQIRDLTNEMKILQQHNNELISLSSKFGQVEMENVELKRKVSEYARDNQSLKSAFSSEQANHEALRAANDKLMKKIEELQRNMDSLTMQLTTFQNQGEIRFASKGTQSEAVRNVNKKIGTSEVSNSYSLSSEEEKDSFYDKVDPEFDRKLKFREKIKSGQPKTKEIKKNFKSEVKDRSGGESTPGSIKSSRLISSKTKNTQYAVSPSMSREKILMLLDQAQISTPLEAQNVARMRQIDLVAAGQNDASIFPESYRIPITSQPRCSNDGFALTDISSAPGDDRCQSYEETEFFDPKQILLMLFGILKSYSEKIHEGVDNSCLCGSNDGESSGTENVDYKNCENSRHASTAEDPDSVKNFERNNAPSGTRPIFKEKFRTGISGTKTAVTGRDKKPSNLLDKFTGTECCTCDSNHRCSATSDCGYGCCTPEIDHGLTLFEKTNNSAVGKDRIGEIGSTIRKVFDSMQMGRDLNYGCIGPCYDPCNEMNPMNTSSRSKIGNSPRGISRELERCRDLLHAHYNLNNDYKQEKNISDCETDCRSENDSGDTTPFCEISALPLLITKGQGLVEIHILALQLSAKASQTLFSDNSRDISVFISWDVWNQETAFTPILKYPSLTFNSSSVYRVSELQNFFQSVLREHIVFQVHVTNSNQETFTIAKARLSVKDILDYPQNKLHYITPVLSTIPCSCGLNFGQLSLWIRLSCDIGLVESFKDRCGLTDPVSKNQQMPNRTQRGEEVPESFSAMKEDFLSNNSAPLNHLYSIPELTARPVRDVMQDIPEQHTSPSGNLLKAESNRLDTIRESAEPQYLAESNEQGIKLGKYRYEDPDKNLSATNIEPHSSLPTSIDNDSRYSNGGIDRTTGERTSQDPQPGAVQTKRDSGEQAESESITEFNSVLKKTDGSSLHGTESTINDLGTVIADDKWNNYKRNSDRSTIGSPRRSENFNSESMPNTVFNKNVTPARETITISIASMNLFDKTSLMNNPDVDLLYIEYCFLGMRGVDMETVSLPKPDTKGETMVFNFSRKFQIDEEYHSSQRNMLYAMLSGTASPIIRFVIVSEPLPEEVDTKECVEVGHADFNIREYALGDGLRVVPLIITDSLQSEQLGMLKITIDGIEIIRNCMMVQKQI